MRIAVEIACDPNKRQALAQILFVKRTARALHTALQARVRPRNRNDEAAFQQEALRAFTRSTARVARA
jgi:hypothetical protein